ncbi:protein translocase subunit SecD [Streptomyces sp. DSM 44915]|uniref:Multifunctional fusion protein n=1 Tax=Streptomyces chisholmiae TaxID=3075540 RepID=A0ABU2JVK6_9ACTN|nr:protein translocase subunit SecD [Streptomyces sp. DSM 44915]MDT0268268.1 protein translocase subunit SecD [Streptomyces sp. DSM 44915]
MTRATRVRCALSLTVLVLSACVALLVPPRLGLDLRGGTQIVLRTQDTDTVEADAAATDRTLAVLRHRVDALGVTEPTLTRSGENRIIVELPGVRDPEEARDVLGRTAQITFHPVLGTAEASEGTSEGTQRDQAGAGELVLPDESGQPLRLGPAESTGADVAGAEARLDTRQGLGWSVTVDFTGAGEAAWGDLTGRAACAAPGDPARRVAIVLDDEVISAPQMDPSVSCGVGITGGSTQITGEFTAADARELELLISGGALPVPVEPLEHRTIGPTLGAQAIDASARAALIGAALTAVFIVVVYRLLGVLATLALACYALISYAALVALGATLTLPGLAGFALAIGMAVDANVLVFERAREEYAARHRTTVRAALATGFRRALGAIADTNITTLIAAALLFFLASGPVRGFGVTLGLGVLASMFSALVITRTLVGLTIDRRGSRLRPGRSGVATRGRVRSWLDRREPRLMRHRRWWLLLSGVAVVLAAVGIGVRGLDLGVEFTGGRMIEYTTERPVDAEEARAALDGAGLPRAVVHASADGDLTVRTGQLSDAEAAGVGEVVSDLGGETEIVRDEMVGPSLGEEIRTAALVALGVALTAQLGYLAVRFRWTYATAAVLTLAQDALLLVGAFAWLGRPIDGIFLAALLTVIGYSVNDSVVVFDRLRELRASGRGGSFAAHANAAVLQTIPRTVNTGMGALFILTALALLGGGSLTDFALALLIGILVGTASTVFTATPLAVALDAAAEARTARTARPSRSAAAGRRAGGRRSRDG